MPDQNFHVDLRDMQFVLFEQLAFEQLTGLELFKEIDRESVELVLKECFRFNRKHIAPHNGSGDQEGCTFKDGVVAVPKGFKESYQAFCDNGWIGVSSPAEQGGMGLPAVVGMATGEMYVGANCSLSLSVGLSRSAASLLQAHGSKEIQRQYLPKLLSGQWQGTMCLTEPQAGSAVGDLKTMAQPDGDSWLLSGSKIFITSGDHDMCGNHVHLVLARTPDAPKGFKGISLFLVPKFLPDAKGEPGADNDVVCAGIEHKMGIKGSPTCTLNFGEQDRCRGWLIGELGAGLKIMFHMMNEARVAVGLQSLSLAAQAYLYAREYANERVQGVDVRQMRDLDAERVLISHHPDVRRMLLWSKAMVEGCRSLIYYTAFHSDLAEHSSDQEQAAKSHALLEILTPICKAYVSDRAFEVTNHAIQILGGYGYVSEYPVEQHLRDVKIASIYEGTNGIQALDLLGRKLGAKQGLYFRTLLEQMQNFADGSKGHLGLKQEVDVFAKELERWGKLTMDIGMMAMQGEQVYPVLSATPYLEMAGNTVVAWLLLRQAVIAHDRLHARYIDKKAMQTDVREQLHRQDPESGFYFNKIEAARFFVFQILARNRGIAAQIDSQDRSALNFVP